MYIQKNHGCVKEEQLNQISTLYIIFFDQAWHFITQFVEFERRIWQVQGTTYTILYNFANIWITRDLNGQMLWSEYFIRSQRLGSRVCSIIWNPWTLFRINIFIILKSHAISDCIKVKDSNTRNSFPYLYRTGFKYWKNKRNHTATAKQRFKVFCDI